MGCLTWPVPDSPSVGGVSLCSPGGSVGSSFGALGQVFRVGSVFDIKKSWRVLSLWIVAGQKLRPVWSYSSVPLVRSSFLGGRGGLIESDGSCPGLACAKATILERRYWR